eukprot:1157271-Pelagomonas_calceolata.AAC.24
MKEKETLAQKSRESPPPQSRGDKGLTGIWRVARSTRLQSLAVRRILVFNSRLVVTSVWAYFTGCALSLRLHPFFIPQDI